MIRRTAAALARGLRQVAYNLRELGRWLDRAAARLELREPAAVSRETPAVPAPAPEPPVDVAADLALVELVALHSALRARMTAPMFPAQEWANQPAMEN